MRTTATFLLSGIFAAAILFSTGCSSPAAESSVVEAPRQHTPRPPILIVVILDESLSTQRTLVSKPTRAEIGELIAILRQAGGELGLTTIRESPQPIFRVRLEPESIDEPQARNILKKSQERTRRRKRVAAVEQENEERISGFIALIQPILERPNNAAMSDVWGALGVAEAMLSESHKAWGAEPVKVVLAATDGEDDVTRRPLALRSGALLAVLNQTGVTNHLAVLRPLTFGSFAAALRHVRALSVN